MVTPAGNLDRAWTKQLDRWFAAPGSVLVRDEVNTAFFFETEFEGTLLRLTHAGFPVSESRDGHEKGVAECAC